MARAPVVSLGLVSLGLGLGALLAPGRASAEERREDAPRLRGMFDELEAPRLPHPFVVPELSHPRPDISLDWTIATMVPEADERSSRQVGLVRPRFETRIGPLRRFYFGVTAPIALAMPVSEGTPSKTVIGNVEAHARVVFPTPSWLAFGGSLGIVVPTSTMDHGTDAEAAARAAASFEPTEHPQFLPHTIAFRPAIDIRLLVGRFVVQVRDGYDVLVDTSTSDITSEGRLLLHAGVLFADRTVEVAFEGTQLYQFASEVHDDDRTALTLGPTVRWTVRDFDLGLATATNYYAPIEGGTARFWAIRLSATYSF